MYLSFICSFVYFHIFLFSLFLTDFFVAVDDAHSSVILKGNLINFRRFLHEIECNLTQLLKPHPENVRCCVQTSPCLHAAAAAAAAQVRWWLLLLLLLLLLGNTWRETARKHLKSNRYDQNMNQTSCYYTYRDYSSISHCVHVS